ncbi:hypothetical protein FRB97_006353, partial [Tulasnella sp. 331]
MDSNTSTESGGPKAVADAAEAFEVFALPCRVLNASSSNVEASFKISTRSSDPFDGTNPVQLSGEMGREIAEVPPVTPSPIRRPVADAWWTIQSPVATAKANTDTTRDTSQAVAATPSPLPRSELNTTAGWSSSALTSLNLRGISSPPMHDGALGRQEGASSVSRGRWPSDGHPSRSPPLQPVATGAPSYIPRGGQSSTPSNSVHNADYRDCLNDAWFVADVKTTVAQDAQVISSRPPARTPFDVDGQAGKAFPRSINVIQSPTLPSQCRSSIPPTIRLESSLLYNPSGSSGASPTAPPLRAGSSPRHESIPGPSALAHPTISPNANAQSTATITFNDGKELMHYQTRRLVFKLVSADLPKASTIRSVKCEKLGKG